MSPSDERRRRSFMSRKISYGNTLGGPVEIHVEDGKIRRLLPLVLRDDDPD